MRLLDSAEVCDLLGVSKSTLYRWCDVSDDSPEGIGLPSSYAGSSAVQKKIKELGISGWPSARVAQEIHQKLTGFDEKPTGFPRPFKIGRSYKWDKDEIESWVKSRRA